MPKKSTVTVDAEEGKTPKRPHPELVRVEDSIEDYLKAELPKYPKTKIEICPLWSKDGRSYFRCKFWQYDTSGIVVTRREAYSHFVYVETAYGKRTLVDLTRKS